MATTKKKTPAKPAEGFLTTAAQAIGSTLGHLAKKAGVASAPAKPARKKAAIKKKAAVRKKAVANKRK